MPRKIILAREYKGCTIWYSTEPGYRLRWTAMTARGQVAADTLAGIKQLIREG
jgi:hypothetical protein